MRTRIGAQRQTQGSLQRQWSRKWSHPMNPVMSRVAVDSASCQHSLFLLAWPLGLVSPTCAPMAGVSSMSCICLGRELDLNKNGGGWTPADVCLLHWAWYHRAPPARGGSVWMCRPGRADSTDAGLQLWRESIAYFLLQAGCEVSGHSADREALQHAWVITSILSV